MINGSSSLNVHADDNCVITCAHNCTFETGCNCTIIRTDKYQIINIIDNIKIRTNRFGKFGYITIH